MRYLRNKSGVEILFFLLIFWIFFLELVDAVGVSGIYTNENYLEMRLGETKEVIFILQNNEGEGDIKLRANISEGQDIVEIIGNKEYVVPADSLNVSVKLNISIPADSKEKEYQIKIDFEPMPLEIPVGGMVQIELGISREFKVKIIREEKTKVELLKNNWIWIILGILVIVAVVVIVKLILENRETPIEGVNEG